MSGGPSGKMKSLTRLATVAGVASMLSKRSCAHLKSSVPTSMRRFLSPEMEGHPDGMPSMDAAIRVSVFHALEKE